MSEDSEPGPGFELLRDPAVLRILANPSRRRIYAAAVERPASAKELAERFDEPLARVSYHVRALADAGLLRPVRQTRRRGAIETHYRAIATLDFSPALMEAAGSEGVALLSQALLREIADDGIDAVEHGAADAADWVLARAHFTVTAEGRRRLYEELLGVYERLSELERELHAEAERSGEAVEEVNVALAFYEGTRERERNRPFIAMAAETPFFLQIPPLDAERPG